MSPMLAGGWDTLTVLLLLLLLCADAATQPHAHANHVVRVSSFPGAARVEQSVKWHSPKHTQAEESAENERATPAGAHSIIYRGRASDAVHTQQRSVQVDATVVMTGRCPLEPARRSPCAMGWSGDLCADDWLPACRNLTSTGSLAQPWAPTTCDCLLQWRGYVHPFHGGASAHVPVTSPHDDGCDRAGRTVLCTGCGRLQ